MHRRVSTPLLILVAIALGAGVYQSTPAHPATQLPVFTSSCRGGPAPYPLAARPVVAFGDSITEGYGATYTCLPRELRSILPAAAHQAHTGDTSYPGDLARILHRTVLDYGVGGELTSAGLPRLRAMVHSLKPSIVVILEGTNDLWGGASTADIVRNLSQMVQATRASGARPVLLTALPIDRPVFTDAAARAQALDRAIRSTARRQGVTLVDAAAAFQAHRPLSRLFQHPDGREDGVHPNDAGYQVLARAVAAALTPPSSH